jgi:hypothetical protein
MQRELEALAWIEANLLPGERLEDFIPPPKAPRSPNLFGNGQRRCKPWPWWANVAALLAVALLWKQLLMALSLALLALFVGLPFWCIYTGWRDRNKPKPKPWAPPRVIPPYRRREDLDAMASRKFSP